jgi:hypothetical protein
MDNSGFDPLRLRSDASLNRTRFGDLPGANPEWIGRPAFDLLSRDALASLTREGGSANAARPFGRRLGHLLATLHAGPDLEPQANGWRRAYLAYWAGVEQVWLGGGLVAALGMPLVDAARAELQRLAIKSLRLEHSRYPAQLALVGCARSTTAGRSNAVVFDFGHSTVKRGIATLREGTLARIELLPVVAAPAPDDVVEFFVETVSTTYRAAVERYEGVQPDLVVSMATYLENAWPLDRWSLYAPLGRLSQEALHEALRDRGGAPLNLTFVHDGTIAARGVRAQGRAAAIVMGTALGVGFAPPPETLVPFAADFSVR